MKDYLKTVKFKTYIIAIGFLTLLGFSIYKYMMVGDITPTVENVLTVMILTLGGLEGVKEVKNLTSEIRQVKQLNKEEREVNKGDVQ